MRLDTLYANDEDGKLSREVVGLGAGRGGRRRFEEKDRKIVPPARARQPDRLYSFSTDLGETRKHTKYIGSRGLTVTAVS